MDEGSNSSMSLPTLLIVYLFVTAILVCVKYLLAVVLVCISMMAIDVEHLSYAYSLSVYLFWRNAHSSLLPILIGLSVYY